MEKPLVSIGIPTYNRPESLRKTLQCITSQTYSNLEIIISNNCSPNPAVEIIIREFAERDSRIKNFLQSDNMGAAFNFIFVLEKAKGNYFMWAADDDEWAPEFIELCMNKHIEDRELCVVMTKYKIRSQNNKWLGSVFALPHFKYLNDPNPLRRIYNFFVERDFTHKANFIYGVWKTEIIKPITKKVFDTNGIFDLGDAGSDIAILCYCFFYNRAYQVNETAYFKNYNNAAPGSILHAINFAPNKWIALKYILNKCNIKYDISGYIKNMQLIFGMLGIKKELTDKMIEIKKKQYFMKP